MKKYKYHCPVDGCSETATSGAGMSAHLRSTHSDVWAGNTQKTLEGLGKETIQVDVTENGLTETTSQKPRSSLTRKDGTTRRKPKVVRRRRPVGIEGRPDSVAGICSVLQTRSRKSAASITAPTAARRYGISCSRPDSRRVTAHEETQKPEPGSSPGRYCP
jgi:hypothetical protein